MLLVLGRVLWASDPAWSQHVAAAQELERTGNFGRAQLELELALGEAHAANDTAAVAHVLDRIGTFADNLGHFVEAESRYEASLRIWRKRLGPEHPSLVRVINRLAAVYLETGQVGKAERLDLARWRERVDPSGDELLPLLQNLGTLDSLRGRFAEALNRFQEALSVIQQRGQNGSPGHAVTLNNLGLACLRARQGDSAIQHLSMSVALWEKLQGAEALSVGLTSYNLGLACEAAGRLGEAESQVRRALAISEKFLGPASLRLAPILQSYAQLLRKLHRKAEATEIAARADRIFREQAHHEPGWNVVDVTDLSFRPW